MKRSCECTLSAFQTRLGLSWIACRWFLAYDFSKLDIEANADGTDEVNVVGFDEVQDGSTFEYRNVLPEAPLERVEGKAHVVSSDGTSLRKYYHL